MQISFRKKTIAIFLLAFLIGINIFAFVRITSFSADNENIMVETNLEKYVNYNVEDKQGTLVQYNVKGMSCSACSARVEKAVSKVPGVTSCTVSLLTNSMGVEGTASPESIMAAVKAAGYKASLKKKVRESRQTAQPQQRQRQEQQPQQTTRLWIRKPRSFGNV